MTRSRALPLLASLTIAADPAAWCGLGFTVEGGGRVTVGGVTIALVADGRGITAWSFHDVDAGEIAGIKTAAVAGARASPHANGASEIDHVVLLTPDLVATTAALAAAGFDERRRRDTGSGATQVFYRMGPILEVVGPVGPRPALWGVVFTVADLDATAVLLGDRLGRVKDAVQPGRRIATLHEPAAGCAVAFMSA